MKKMLFAVLAVLIFLMPLSAKADSPNVVDKAGILTDSQYSDLLQRTENLTEEYGIDTIIIILDTLNGADPQAAADDLFDSRENGYGYGSDHSGVLLLYAVRDRDLAISTFGKGIKALTDRRIEHLFDVLEEDLSRGDTYNGLCSYLSALESDYRSYYEGSAPMPFGLKLLIAMVIGLIAASVTVLVMKSKMRTARQRSGANEYIAPGSFDLYNSRDIFLYSQTSRTRRETDNGGGGGSSIHTSSSGRSHGGGTRHF